ALLQGLSRARLRAAGRAGSHFTATVSVIKEPEASMDVEVEASMRNLRKCLERILTLGKGLNPEVTVIANGLEDPGQLADLVASNLDLKNEEVQDVLETLDPAARIRKVVELAQREVQILTMQQQIHTNVRGEIDRNQREYYLR